MCPATQPQSVSNSLSSTTRSLRPPNSPNLNLIKHLWGELDKQVQSLEAPPSKLQDVMDLICCFHPGARNHSNAPGVVALLWTLQNFNSSCTVLCKKKTQTNYYNNNYDYLSSSFRLKIYPMQNEGEFYLNCINYLSLEDKASQVTKVSTLY